MSELDIKEKARLYLESQISKDIQTITAFTIRKTKTEKDDEIIDNIAEVKDILADVIDGVAKANPTESEAKQAAIRILEQVALLTKTPWDDRLVAVLKKFVK